MAVTKTALIAAIAEQLGVTKKVAAQMVDSFVSIVVKEVKSGGEVRIQGFGTFKSVKRKARKGVNPRTGESIQIPAMTVPKFQPGSDFKKAVR